MGQPPTTVPNEMGTGLGGGVPGMARLQGTMQCSILGALMYTDLAWPAYGAQGFLPETGADCHSA